jgi:hypothetical protein
VSILVNFLAPGSGSAFAFPIRIRIQESQINADPDPYVYVGTVKHIYSTVTVQYLLYVGRVKKLMECWCEQELRELVRELKERGEYTRGRLVAAWGLAHVRPASWQQLATRLQDCSLPRPSQDTPTGSTLQHSSILHEKPFR